TSLALATSRPLDPIFLPYLPLRIWCLMVLALSTGISSDSCAASRYGSGSEASFCWLPISLITSLAMALATSGRLFSSSMINLSISAKSGYFSVVMHTAHLDDPDRPVLIRMQCLDPADGLRHRIG